jgi:hypothetical protein
VSGVYPLATWTARRIYPTSGDLYEILMGWWQYTDNRGFARPIEGGVLIAMVMRSSWWFQGKEAKNQ